MPGVSQRIASISESSTLAITTKANALRAAGHSVIGFGAGEPDFPTPDAIVVAAAAATRDPAMHKYTPSGGLPSLREAVANKTLRDSGFEVEPSQVVVTNGGKHAVYSTIQCLVDPGDEVILPAPYWVTYPPAVSLAGGTTVAIETAEEAMFKVTVEQLEAARTLKTKLLIFVSPSNPTGTVYTRDEVVAIGQWAAEHGIWVLTDEIYEHLTYAGATFTSMPAEVPEVRERCVVVNGVAKTYAMTGWRVGWIIGPQVLVDSAIKLQGHSTSNVNNVAQAAALAAVQGPLDDVVAMRSVFDQRRRKMIEMLNAIVDVNCVEPLGAFYAFPSLHAALGRTLGGRKPATTLELAEICLEEIGVAFVPGEAFGAPGYARFSYSIASDDMETGLSRFAEFLR